MNRFDNVLAEIFDQGAEARLTPADEANAIRLAKEGDSGATVDLLFAYAPALRNVVGRYRDALGAADARSYAVEGLLTAVRDFDPERGERLAGPLADTLARVLSEACVREAAFTIPPRTLQRFYSALRDADGDVAVGMDVAEGMGMTRETFAGVLTVLRQTDSLDAEVRNAEGVLGESGDVDARPLWEIGDGFEDVEDRLLVSMAFGAVEPLEEEVCRYAYGFETGESLSDAGVVQEKSIRDLGEDAVDSGQTAISRPKVQRTRASALAKMRVAVGA